MQTANASSRLTDLQRSISRVVKGKEEVIQMALMTLLARGHLLIEDVPGVGKTTLAHAIARSFHCSFQRIQFTSDLLPGDVIGVSVYNPVTQEFDFKPGPVFANIIVADEINRTTPKNAVSRCSKRMNESQITVDNHTYPLPSPFLVLATQNPIEHHGTYPPARIADGPFLDAHPHGLSRTRQREGKSSAATPATATPATSRR